MKKHQGKRRDKNKVKRFVKEYSKDLNAHRAMGIVSPDLSGVALNVKTGRWMKAEEVREQIRKELEAFDSSLINKDYVFMNLYKIISDVKTPKNVRVNAISVLSKCLNLSKETTINLTNNMISQDKLKELIGRRTKDRELPFDTQEVKHVNTISP